MISNREAYALRLFNRAIDKFHALPQDKVRFMDIFVQELRDMREQDKTQSRISITSKD